MNPLADKTVDIRIPVPSDRDKFVLHLATVAVDSSDDHM